MMKILNMFKSKDIREKTHKLNRQAKYRSIGFFLGLVISVNTFASVITPTSDDSDQIHQFSLASENADLLHVKKANSSGISVNRFDTFEVSAKALKIANVKRQASDATEAQTRLIVVIANNFVFENEIELLGPASDILFLSTSDTGAVSCNACVFKNFHRVTFAVASPESTISDNIQQIGKLNTASNGSISINNMSSPGLLALDLFSNTLSLDGEINLHQRADQDALGGYTQNENGAYTIGTGSVNINLGQIKWDYDNQLVEGVTYDASSTILNGSIKSVAVKVTSSSDLTINTHVDTRTNLVSSIRYKNQTYIANEGIIFQTIGNAYMNVNGNQSTNGVLAIKATGDLNFPTSLTYLEAGNVDIISGNKIVNDAFIKANNIKVAANTIKNEGRLDSDNELQVWADSYILNQYGGIMIADALKLQSKTSFIRNGSRKPYQSEESENNDLLIFSNDYIEELNASQLGLFFMDGVTVDTSATSNFVMANDNSAHIGARTLEIVGTGFENINPYYKRVGDDGVVALSRDQIDEVTVTGEDYLAIYTSNYVINSSAHMRMSSETGLFKIRTGMLTNERYRIQSILDKQEYSGANPGAYSTDLTTISSKTAVYSPPGHILSMGDLEVEATQGFVNNVSYVEVYDDAKIQTSTLNDIGLKHGSITKDVSVVPSQVFRCWKRHWRTRCRWLPSTKTEITVTLNTLEEMDSLFFVHGDATSSSVGEIFKNHEPLSSFRDVAIQTAIDRDFSQIEDGVTNVTRYYGYHYWLGRIATSDTYETKNISTNIGSTSFSISVTTDAETKEYLGTKLVPIMVDGITIFIPVDDHADPVFQNTSTSTTEYSIADELIKLYDALVEVFTSLLNEIDWWAEE